MNNTLIGYLYRDASNFKTFFEVVVNGDLAEEDINPLLFEKEFFIPSEVGLRDLQNDLLTQDDHIWHEITSIEPTAEPATLAITANELLTQFRRAADMDWNQYAVLERKGIV